MAPLSLPFWSPLIDTSYVDPGLRTWSEYWLSVGCKRKVVFGPSTPTSPYRNMIWSTLALGVVHSTNATVSETSRTISWVGPSITEEQICHKVMVSNSKNILATSQLNFLLELINDSINNGLHSFVSRNTHKVASISFFWSQHKSKPWARIDLTWSYWRYNGKIGLYVAASSHYWLDH